MEYPNFALVRPADHPGVVELRIDRPDKRNAMTVAMWRDLAEIAAGLAADPTLRVVVVSGTGPTFCAGADIGALAQDDATMRQVVGAAEAAIRELPVPTIAKIRGHCMGGGTQIAIACDLRIADETARFAVPPARLSVVYAASSIRALTALVGPGTAKRLLFTAETIDAATALRVGLVEDLVGAAELDARVTDIVRAIEAGAPLTQAAAKAVVAALGGGAAERVEAERVEAEWVARWAASADGVEGPRAFLERRAPVFTWQPRPGSRDTP